MYSLGGRPGSSLAIRSGGNGDVTDLRRLWKRRKGSNVSPPVYQDGYLYWMHDQRGIAYCADAQTGNLVYEERLPRTGQVYSSALLADHRIYYVTRSRRTFVVAARPELSSSP